MVAFVNLSVFHCDPFIVQYSVLDHCCLRVKCKIKLNSMTSPLFCLSFCLSVSVLLVCLSVFVSQGISLCDCRGMHILKYGGRSMPPCSSTCFCRFSLCTCIAALGILRSSPFCLSHHGLGGLRLQTETASSSLPCILGNRTQVFMLEEQVLHSPSHFPSPQSLSLPNCFGSSSSFTFQ